MRGLCLALLALPVGSALQAQAIKNEPPMRHFTEAEVAEIAMPVLAFEPTQEATDDIDKYFYFHRAETGFDEAYADILECDSLSSGISIYRGADQSMMTQAAVQYGIGGVIGGAIGSALADAIFGSAQRRQARRTNMRTCMYFKGYDRFGLAKDQWEEFNFEEGNGRKEEDVREQALLKQARVASGPRPQQEVLEP